MFISSRLLVLSHSVMSNALGSHGLKPARLLSIHGIFQARILEWVAIPYCRVSSRPRDQTHISCVSCIAEKFFITSATWDSLPSAPSRVHPFLTQALLLSSFCRWEGGGQVLGLWENLLLTSPQPLVTLSAPFLLQDKLRPEAGTGISTPVRSAPFVARAASCGPSPVRLPGRGRGPGFPLP